MSCFIIRGPRRLDGEITVQGSKNGSLPLLSAAVLARGETVLENCPELTDTAAACDILTYLGCRVVRSVHTVAVESSAAVRSDIPDSLMQEMRSSVVFLGALLGRFGRAELSAPGGCEIGLRPIDIHLEAMHRLGTRIEESNGRLICSCPHGLKGTEICLSFPSVGATENVLLAASVAKGETRLINAAREPEIKALADFLNKCGARISGAGESTIVINGVRKLAACEHKVGADRIAATTFLAATAATSGKIRLNGTSRTELIPAVELFEKSGCVISEDAYGLCLEAPHRLRSLNMIRTMPYPGFPTDSQADFGVLASISDSMGIIIENIFENRFKYLAELKKMGARVQVQERAAFIQGVDCLQGACVYAPDLRGGAALTVAGLCAQGETRVENIHHIDRGYERFECRLAALGADIRREKHPDN